MKYEKVKGSKSPALLGLRKNLFEYWDTFEKLEDVLPSEDKFYNTLTNLAIRDKAMNMFLMFGKLLKWTLWKIYHDLYLKVHALLLACVF